MCFPAARATIICAIGAIYLFAKKTAEMRRNILLGRDEDAINQLVAAINLSPKDIELFSRLATLLESRGRLNDAAQIWRDAANASFASKGEAALKNG